MTSLIHSIYSSVASDSFNEDEIPALLSRSRHSNLRRGVTGMLVYINGNFLQIVEGEEPAVDVLLRTIELDARHHRINVLARERIRARSFGQWSMGFESLLSSDVGELVGENDFFDGAECLSSLNPGIVKSILSAFRDAQTYAAPRQGDGT